jgi:hypothetical protein
MSIQKTLHTRNQNMMDAVALPHMHVVLVTTNPDEDVVYIIWLAI